MKHSHILYLVASVCLAADGKPASAPAATPDLSQMPAEIHAPLFQSKKPPQPGALTERLTSGLAKPAAASSIPRRNFIDNHIFGKMQRDGIPHAPLATDREFVRRVTLDLTGRIPSRADLEAFLNDSAPDRRARLIQRLIESPAFADDGTSTTIRHSFAETPEIWTEPIGT